MPTFGHPMACKRSQCLGEDAGQNFVEHVESLKLPLDEVSVGVARGPANDHDEIAMASRGSCRYDWSADVGGQSSWHSPRATVVVEDLLWESSQVEES